MAKTWRVTLPLPVSLVSVAHFVAHFVAEASK